MSDKPRLALIFDFDGTLYVGDLPVLAYARHAAQLLPDDAATDLIDGIRYFLEGRAVNAPTVDLNEADDAHHAVELLAAAAGLTEDQLSGAYRRARADLAGSAFALDAPDGLVELLDELQDAHVMVVTNADLTGVAEVLTAIGLAGHIDEIVTDAGKPASMPAIIDRTLELIGAAVEPHRLLVVGDRWTADLADAHRVGALTALVDRFRRGAGEPSIRAGSLGEMVPQIRAWAAGHGAAG